MDTANRSSSKLDAGEQNRPAPKRTATLKAVLLHSWCDNASEWLIYFAIVFSPWAFGTTQPWSMRIMNLAGYSLAALLFIKVFLRHFRHVSPPRWGAAEGTRNGWFGRFAMAMLAVLTFALLAFCLIAAANARSIYDAERMEFLYKEHIPWLPHSYDQVRSWQAFANYTALAGFFWALRDWLLGKTAGEARATNSSGGHSGRTFHLPGRLRRLLWVLSINGAVLGLEGIAQRLSGTNLLLGFQPTRINAHADYQFGPYAYRSNAAQYFNLVWPVTLAFWWTLRREMRSRLHEGDWRSHAAPIALLLMVIIMVTCPIMSLSRGGALVAFGGMAVSLVLVLSGLRRSSVLMRLSIVLVFAIAAGIGLWFEWDKLAPRMKDSGAGLKNREVTYSIARQMTKDFPIYGVGPGAFEPVFQTYRTSFGDYWPKQLHNDWLETRITFGWVGSGMAFIALLLATTRWFGGGSIGTGWRFTTFLWLALGGCLTHALYDFPLQIYSVLMCFLLLCAILTTLGRHAKTEPRET